MPIMAVIIYHVWFRVQKYIKEDIDAYLLLVDLLFTNVDLFVVSKYKVLTIYFTSQNLSLDFF